MSEQRLVDVNHENIFRLDADTYPDRMYACGWNGMVHVIEELPPIDPETLPIVRELRARIAELENKLKECEPVIHAHWEDMEPENTDEEHEYRCSKCLVYATIHPALLHNAKFCHGCGAKMDEEEIK